MALVVALVAEHLTDIFLGFRIRAGLSMVMIMASISIDAIMHSEMIFFGKPPYF